MAAYQSDKDLDFLEKVHGNDLVELIFILAYNKLEEKNRADNSKRVTCSWDDGYIEKTLNKEPEKHWQEIAAELQTFGGNTIVNFFRGHGVLYDEIVNDVADALDIDAFEPEIHIHKKEQLIKKKYQQTSDSEFYFKSLFLPSPAYRVTIPAVLYIADLREKYFKNFYQNAVMPECNLAILGMKAAGKSTFLKILQSGDFEDEYKQTDTEEPYEPFKTNYLGIQIQGGMDISGDEGMVRTAYSKLIANKDIVLFFFNTKLFITETAQYKYEVLGRIRYIYDSLSKNGTLNNPFKFKIIATHIDECPNSDIRQLMQKNVDEQLSDSCKKWIIENLNTIFSPVSLKDERERIKLIRFVFKEEVK